MPVHHVPISEVEKAVADAERSERIIAVTSDGHDGVLIVTEPKRKSPARETR